MASHFPLKRVRIHLVLSSDEGMEARRPWPFLHVTEPSMAQSSQEPGFPYFENMLSE